MKKNMEQNSEESSSNQFFNIDKTILFAQFDDTSGDENDNQNLDDQEIEINEVDTIEVFYFGEEVTEEAISKGLLYCKLYS